MSEPDPNYSVNVRDFSLWYGDFQALKNVSLNLRDGIITSLIRPVRLWKDNIIKYYFWTNYTN